MDLDLLFSGDLSRNQAVLDGLLLSGRARGLLNRWLRGSRGDWLGEVHYEIHRNGENSEPVVWAGQLVPATALSRRYDSVPLQGVPCRP